MSLRLPADLSTLFLSVLVSVCVWACAGCVWTVVVF